MHIRIAFYGESRKITGTEEELLEISSDISLAEIVRRLAEKYGDAMSLLLLTDTGKLRRSVIFAINDEVVDPVEKSILQDNDVLSILPAVAGG
jgi:molybdopterin converting factor small subunit